jgi:diaminopimelate dehydrogenase
MGHSNALLTIPGVRKAIQYTHAIPETIERARRGEVIPENEKTVTREAILVLERNTPDERARVEPLVRNMKDYFRGYKTTVDFVDDETFDREHADAKQHDGVVIGVGKIGKFTSRHELHCAYESNAHGTTGIMVANARGAYRLWQEGRRGVCISPEIPTTYKNARSIRDLLKRFM